MSSQAKPSVVCYCQSLSVQGGLIVSLLTCIQETVKKCSCTCTCTEEEVRGVSDGVLENGKYDDVIALVFEVLIFNDEEDDDSDSELGPEAEKNYL